jgi:monofunctional biosynthetic peptidoglycan transglycosylase
MMSFSTLAVGFVAVTLVYPGFSGEHADKMTTIFTFDTQTDVGVWPATNDGVMGGLSDGRSQITKDGFLRFSGNLSLENNGGFSSIQSATVERDLSAHEGILLRVRGDGKRYALTIRTNIQIRAGSYRVKFDTKKDEWIEIFVPFDGFRATSFGIEMPNAPPLDRKRIRSFGFLISDKQVGPFTLEVDWIKAGARE